MQCSSRVPTLGWALILVFGFLAGVYAQAASPMAGTWILNVAKSKYSPGPPPKSGTSRYEVTQDGIKTNHDGVNAQGQRTTQVSACKFGQDCAPTRTIDGSPNPSQVTIVWKRVDDYTYEYTTKTANDPSTEAGRIVIAKDGKTMSRTISGKNAQGQAVNNTVFHEKR